MEISPREVCFSALSLHSNDSCGTPLCACSTQTVTGMHCEGLICCGLHMAQSGERERYPSINPISSFCKLCGAVKKQLS